MLKLKRIGKRVETSRSLAYSWILMWSLSYIAVAFLKPNLVFGVHDILSFVNPIHLGFGSFLLIALIFNVKVLLFLSGTIEVLAGVASWVGLIQWNVLWTIGYDPLAQISMAILDLVTAAILFHFALDSRPENRRYVEEL